VLAPSESIPTTEKGGGYGHGGYTSIAAPQVAGIAALILSIRPGLSVDQLIQVIEQGADPVDGQTDPTAQNGYGRVNAYQSLVLAQALVSAAPTIVHQGPAPLRPSRSASTVRPPAREWSCLVLARPAMDW
jgi:subtilisin family serine protease